MRETLVGRDRAVAATKGFLASLRAGPRALIVEGDAGIGKSAVWRASLDAARQAGYLVLDGVGEQVEARMSFVGLADLVGDRYDEFAGALPSRQRHALDYALLRGSAGVARAP